VAALQRPLDEEVPLAGPDALSARLSEPLVAPPEVELVLETRSTPGEERSVAYLAPSELALAGARARGRNRRARLTFGAGCSSAEASGLEG
jgi:hypothetical protein